MHPHQAAKERPLVVVFCWERFDILRMTLPRIVNATRRIGGYLWAIDDGSDDDRVPRMLMEYHEKGWIDWITLGKQTRFIDWIGARRPGVARRSVVIRWLYKKRVPFAFLVESDYVVGKDVFLQLLQATHSIFSTNQPAYAVSGCHGNQTIFNAPITKLDGFEFRLNGAGLAQGIVLLPFRVVDRVEKGVPERGERRFSLNQYALRAATQEHLQSYHVMNLAVQHLGVGIVGRSVTTKQEFFMLSWTDKDLTKLVNVPGFDVERFMEVARQTLLSLQSFSRRDAAKQTIDEPQDIPAIFTDCMEILRF